VKDMLSGVGASGGAPAMGRAVPAAGAAAADAAEAPKEGRKRRRRKSQTGNGAFVVCCVFRSVLTPFLFT
jgi:hypothetical protein